MLKKDEMGKDASRRPRRVSAVARLAGERVQRNETHNITTLQCLLAVNIELCWCILKFNYSTSTLFYCDK